MRRNLGLRSPTGTAVSPLVPSLVMSFALCILRAIRIVGRRRRPAAAVSTRRTGRGQDLPPCGRTSLGGSWSRGTRRRPLDHPSSLERVPGARRTPSLRRRRRREQSKPFLPSAVSIGPSPSAGRRDDPATTPGTLGRIELGREIPARLDPPRPDTREIYAAGPARPSESLASVTPQRRDVSSSRIISPTARPVRPACA